MTKNPTITSGNTSKHSDNTKEEEEGGLEMSQSSKQESRDSSDKDSNQAREEGGTTTSNTNITEAQETSAKLDILLNVTQYYLSPEKKRRASSQRKENKGMQTKEVERKDQALSPTTINEESSSSDGAFTEIELWNIRYEELRDFMRKNGRLPKSSEGHIGKWLSSQRTMFRGGILDTGNAAQTEELKGRLQKLEDLGLEFEISSPRVHSLSPKVHEHADTVDPGQMVITKTVPSTSSAEQSKSSDQSTDKKVTRTAGPCESILNKYGIDPPASVLVQIEARQRVRELMKTKPPSFIAQPDTMPNHSFDPKLLPTQQSMVAEDIQTESTIEDVVMKEPILDLDVTSASVIDDNAAKEDRPEMKQKIKNKTSYPIKAGPGVKGCRPGSRDVLLGRGRENSCHLGNKVFRLLMTRYKTKYSGLGRGTKGFMVKNILHCWSSVNGRFLSFDDKAKEWEATGNAEAYDKVSMFLRQKERNKNKPSAYSIAKDRDPVIFETAMEILTELEKLNLSFDPDFAMQLVQEVAEGTTVFAARTNVAPQHSSISPYSMVTVVPVQTVICPEVEFPGTGMLTSPPDTKNQSEV